MSVDQMTTAGSDLHDSLKSTEEISEMSFGHLYRDYMLLFSLHHMSDQQ